MHKAPALSLFKSEKREAEPPGHRVTGREPCNEERAGSLAHCSAPEGLRPSRYYQGLKAVLVEDASWKEAITSTLLGDRIVRDSAQIDDEVDGITKLKCEYWLKRLLLILVFY